MGGGGGEGEGNEAVSTPAPSPFLSGGFQAAIHLSWSHL